MLDNNYEQTSSLMLYDFVEVNSLAAVLPGHTSEPFYLIDITEKDIAKDMIKDRLGHVIP